MVKQGQKTPLVVLIGGGSRFPAIYEYTQKEGSTTHIALVVSHKKESPGIKFALERRIPAVFWNLIEWKKKTGLKREEYANALGYFISQTYYTDGPHGLIVMAGWDLVMPESFLKHFELNRKYRAINLHPALLPDNPNDEEVTVSNGDKVPVLRGLHSNQVFEEALKRGLKWTGATVHWVTPQVDVGEVILRGEVEVKKGDTVETLAERVHQKEDEVLSQAIDLAIS